MGSFDVSCGVLEGAAALAYAAGAYLASVDAGGALRFRPARAPDRVVCFNALEHGVTLGSDSAQLVNSLRFNGHPLAGGAGFTRSRPDSVDAFGLRERSLDYVALSRSDDAARLVSGFLADLAYPATTGALTFFRGDAALAVGDLVELRGAPLRRLDRELPEEWDGIFTGRRIARVDELTHRFSGCEAATTARLGPPLRSVENPLAYIVRNAPSPAALFGLRLDDGGALLDSSHRLD
jgi:hypothetical protein